MLQFVDTVIDSVVSVKINVGNPRKVLEFYFRDYSGNPVKVQAPVRTCLISTI